MQVIHLNYPNQDYYNVDPVSMAVGYFDGLHLGHQEVIHEAIRVADERNLKSAVMTFHPHPLSVLKQEPLKDFLITSLDDKIKLFSDLNIDYLFIVTFNKDLAKLSPEDFVQKFFIDINVKHVVGGFDFSFGHKGSGKIQKMNEYANGQLTYSVVDKVSYEGDKVSSTRIRDLLNEGQLEAVTKLLGRPFTLTAEVIHGEKRGREIGYPTANLHISTEQKLPKVGVYAVYAYVNGQSYYGMANIGYNPTFTDGIERPIVEVHLFDFDEDIYHQSIRVEFHYYIRDEEKFNDIDDLIARMKEDEIETKNFFQIPKG
ncbi:bifunctional riboflavin kinase/FAD synthetase [Aquisalibacillus elongatus]|uniref:Riboflavin biosynthesis protein n=1 Tax=Aquisalibacillus elongatus TaxID=485577 RepID=A0A3N5BGS0_9BACI|nr:bifunctional riboflavin kinase/FAD synthetase [Aquisalibacillus elongatus]RPF55949.1 FMN adenylyltransferase /riboflavin kinase [Aquisalibacillus elongatus]